MIIARVLMSSYCPSSDFCVAESSLLGYAQQSYSAVTSREAIKCADASLAFPSAAHMKRKTDKTHDHLRCSITSISAAFSSSKKIFRAFGVTLLLSFAITGKSLVDTKLLITPKRTYFVKQQPKKRFVARYPISQTDAAHLLFTCCTL